MMVVSACVGSKKDLVRVLGLYDIILKEPYNNSRRRKINLI